MSDKLLDLETMDWPSLGSGADGARHVTLTLLHHPEARRVGERAQLPLLAHPRARAGLARGEPKFRAPGTQGTPLLSPFISRKPLWLEGLAQGGVRLDPSETGSRVTVDGVPLAGALDLDAARLDAGVVLQVGSHIVVFLNREPPAETGAADDFGIAGDSEGIRGVRASVARLAHDDASVLIRGETGSGKEVVAGALHRASPRKQGPFIAVNMAAVPATLAASELFGHARGAFSGATDAHDGFFLRAHGGTLFLDEVADTPPDVQAALLRVLETSEVQALGSRTTKKVDVRVLAATDGDLEDAVAAGRFRAPLYYRLAAGEVRVPPLRERRADIGRLAVRFLGAELAAMGRRHLLEPELTEEHPWLPAELVANLCLYSWPGNVRQLKNVCHVLALASGSGKPLSVDDAELARAMPRARSAPVSSPSMAAAKPVRTSDIDPDELERVLAALDYRLGAAAEHFGVSRPTLNELVDKHPRLVRAQRLEADAIRQAIADGERQGRPAWQVLAVSERGLQRRMKELGLL